GRRRLEERSGSGAGEVVRGDRRHGAQGEGRAAPRPRDDLRSHLGERGDLTMANMAQAIRMALHYAEENLGVTDIFGEDVGMPLGGVFTCTQGLKTTWNSPLDERGIIGAAMGLAMGGGRPVAEIQFCDYVY